MLVGYDISEVLWPNYFICLLILAACTTVYRFLVIDTLFIQV